MLDARQIAARYGGKAHSQTQCNIPTPGHSRGDRGTSISTKADAPDGVLIHCHNGSADDALAVKDMLRRDGFLPERNKTSFRPRTRFTPRAMPTQSNAAGKSTAYAYHDEKGEELYRKVRTDYENGEKDFTWLHDGGRKNGKGGKPSIPYRLDELVSDTESLIVMAEGEKCADHLVQLGFLATSSKDLPESLPWFAGRKVAILPDNDREGERAAHAAKRKVEQSGGEAFIVELPDLPDAGDVCDWPGGAEDIERELGKTSGRKKKAGLLPLINFSAWKGEPPARRSLWGDWLPVHQTTMLTGAGGVGKSLFDQTLCTAIALGLPFLGMETVKRNTLYITCEDDHDELWRRQWAINKAFNVTQADIEGKLHLCHLTGVADTALATAKADNKEEIEPTDRWHEVCNTCEQFDIGLFAFDNATDALAADHNQLHPVAGFINMLTGLAIERDGVAMIIHHPNKGGDDWLGSVGYHNKVRSRLIIKHGDDEADRDARYIENPKANYGPSGGRIDFRWHNGIFVRDEDLPPDTAAELSKSILANHENSVFLDCLRKRTEQNRPVGPSPSANYAPSQFAQMTEAKGISKAKLTRAMERLFHIGAIEVQEVKREGKGGTKTIIVEVAG